MTTPAIISNPLLLHHLVARSAQQAGQHVAVSALDGCVTYAQLQAQADTLAYWLSEWGLKSGDRVAIYAPKSTRVIALMQAVLRLGAVYVPIDSLSPHQRMLTIIEDCQVSVLATTAERFAAIAPKLSGRLCLLLDQDSPADGVLNDRSTLSWPALIPHAADLLPSMAPQPEDIAYILYTSGSTGVPKGVCLTHAHALNFVRWAVQMLKASSDDRFANHAALNFDLSVLDLYAAFAVGAQVALIAENDMFSAQALKQFFLHRRIRFWYSVPTAIVMMMEQTDWLTHDCPHLHSLLFAGEVFPLPLLKRLREHWPAKRLINLYGPTETNVCTYFEVKQINPAWHLGVPIGQACCGNWLRIIDAQGEDVSTVHEAQGELVVQGPSVMKQYWGQPPVSVSGYATGDLVQRLPSGDLLYLGRKDQRVKLGGYRVELGEIEAALLTHPQIQAAAAYVEHRALESKLVAVIVAKCNPPPSLLSIKQHCVQRLPAYMLPKKLRCVERLPITPNGKLDRLALPSWSTTPTEEPAL